MNWNPRIAPRHLVSGLIGPFGGGILFIASFFVAVGQDYSQEATVGIITKQGLPFPYAFTAPGYAWTQFDASSALASYIVLSATVFGIYIMACSATRRRKVIRSVSEQTTAQPASDGNAVKPPGVEQES